MESSVTYWKKKSTWYALFWQVLPTILFLFNNSIRYLWQQESTHNLIFWLYHHLLLTSILNEFEAIVYSLFLIRTDFAGLIFLFSSLNKLLFLPLVRHLKYFNTNLNIILKHYSNFPSPHPDLWFYLFLDPNFKLICMLQSLFLKQGCRIFN